MSAHLFGRCLTHRSSLVPKLLVRCSRQVYLPPLSVLSDLPSNSGSGRSKCCCSTLKAQTLPRAATSTPARAVLTEDTPVTDLLQSLSSKSSELSSTDGHSPAQDLLLSIIGSDQKSNEDIELLQEFVLSRIKCFNASFLPVLLSALLKNKCLSRPIADESTALTSQLLRDDRKGINFGTLFWVFGKYFHYSEPLCEVLPEIFKKGRSILSPWLVSTVAWYCARVRYYDPTLLNEIAEYSLRNGHRYTFHDLSNVTYSLGYLNHAHPAFMEAVGKRLEQEFPVKGEEQVYWVYVWACLVLDMPRRGVLKQVLSEEFIQASLKSPHYEVCLLQVSIALNYEHPELNMAGEDVQSHHSKWGVCFPSVSGLDKEFMRRSTLSRLQRYRHSGSARRFSENIKRALRQVVGKSAVYNTEALSLSGYSVDFELLFDSRNRLIPIPRRWRMKFKEDVLCSIGFMKKHKRTISPTPTLIESLKMAETQDWEIPQELSIPSNFNHRDQINLASDWGSKFDCLSGFVVKRRVAIEADGLPHFASNCDHVLGPTVLKHRQLRALGWEVVQIPYKEWEELQSGDDHVKYLNHKLFNGTH